MSVQTSDYKQAAKDSIKSLHVFLQNMWPVLYASDPLIDNWHIKFLCDFIQDQFFAWLNGKEFHRHVIINVPPGTSKSTIFSVMFPLWCWLHKPDMVIFSTCYGEVIIDQSLKSKRIFKSEKFQYYFQGYFESKFGHKMYLIKDTEKWWTNNYGGERQTMTTTGASTGRHCHWILSDDPMSKTESYSDAKRLTCHNFNDKTLPTRRKEPTRVPTYQIMQRLHHDDTTAHELGKPSKKIHHIVLPAKTGLVDVKPARLAKYYVDGHMDINRLGPQALHDFKVDLGSADFNGQYMQSPVEPGGNIVKTAWFQYCDLEEVPSHIVFDLWIDGAYTKKTENDPTGLMVAGYDYVTNRIYVRHFHSAWMELYELLNFLPEYCKLHGLDNQSRVFVEPKASGHDIISMLRKETVLSPIEIKGKLVSDGKYARLGVAAPKIESGKWWVVRGNWNAEYTNQLSMYPRHGLDEAVDTSGYAANRYFDFDDDDAVTRQN